MGETLATSERGNQTAQRNIIGYEDGFEISKKSKLTSEIPSITL